MIHKDQIKERTLHIAAIVQEMGKHQEKIFDQFIQELKNSGHEISSDDEDILWCVIFNDYDNSLFDSFLKQKEK